MDDSDYEEEYNSGSDDGPQYAAERSAYERTGKEDPFTVVFDKPEPSEKKEHDKWVRGLSKRERFYYTIRTEVIPEIEDIFPGQITKQVLVDKTLDLVGLEYRNPWAFVLGFIASGGGRRLEKAEILNTLAKTPVAIKEKYGITPPDVIRYARYWVRFIE